jgi:hypothetical protein
LGQEIEERKQTIRDCEAMKRKLTKRITVLGKELEDLGQKYCALNEQITGDPPNKSKSFLQSIRDDPNGSRSSDAPAPPRLPLLHKYAEVANELDEHLAHIRQVEEMKGKLDFDRERVPSLAKEEEKLVREMRRPVRQRRVSCRPLVAI